MNMSARELPATKAAGIRIDVKKLTAGPLKSKKTSGDPLKRAGNAWRYVDVVKEGATKVVAVVVTILVAVILPCVCTKATSDESISLL